MKQPSSRHFRKPHVFSCVLKPHRPKYHPPAFKSGPSEKALARERRRER